MCRPSPHHWKTDALECSCHRSLILSSCLVVESFHFHQCPSPSISGIPSNTIFVLSFCHLRRPQSFPPTDHRRHKRNWPLTRDILRNQEEHRYAGLLRPSPTLFHLLQELHHFSSCFSCQIQRNFGVKAIASCSCLFLVSFCRILLEHPLSLFNSSFLHGLSFRFSHIRIAFLFSSHLDHGLASSSSLLQNLSSSSRQRWFGTFVQMSCTFINTFDHTTAFFGCSTSVPFTSSFLFISFSQS